MSSLLRVLAIVAQLGVCSLATDCVKNPGLCAASEDATSLMQVRTAVSQPSQTTVVTKTITKTITSDSSNTIDYANLGATNHSDVEKMQGLLKLAISNTTIARYAAARANMNKAKAIYASLKASYKSEDTDFESSEAGRMAKKALITAFDEEQAWQQAMTAEAAAANASAIARDDYEGKHSVMMNYSYQADLATQARQAAQENATEVRMKAQADVDRALATLTAKDAFKKKVAAAAAVAAQKLANEQAKEAYENNKEQNKEAYQSWKQAMHSEWDAHKKAVGAQWDSMQAEAAKVDMELDAAANVSLMEAANNSLVVSPVEEAQNAYKTAKFNARTAKAAAVTAKQLISGAVAESTEKSLAEQSKHQVMMNAERAAARAQVAANEAAALYSSAMAASAGAMEAAATAQADADAKLAEARAAAAAASNATTQKQAAQLDAKDTKTTAQSTVDDKYAELSAKNAHEKKVVAAGQASQDRLAQSNAKAKMIAAKEAIHAAKLADGNARRKEWHAARESAHAQDAAEEAAAAATTGLIANVSAPTAKATPSSP